ncbi:MAG: hypothetical protein J5U17_10725 [Candidatus Methanoperedens sp.]|nr:hypothetical protein [Candidatus Methanoperedens sp.]MCE8426237.1 hypothetical protein [Candidatus Methanoperedens sp.]MCE8428793.1 hypothetical protein [Candidatus Methanoperedens sp.]
MKIRAVSGCAIGKGIFASFAGFEKADILPLRLVTECNLKLTRNCNIDNCPRFRTGMAGSHKISWQNKEKRM